MLECISINIIHTIYKMFQLPFIGYIDYDASSGVIKKGSRNVSTKIWNPWISKFCWELGGIFGRALWDKKS